MIDEFIEFILVPIIPLLFHVVLIFLNVYSYKQFTTKSMYYTAGILWCIATLLIPPLLWTIVFQVTSLVTLSLISLCLMFLQLLLNIDYIMRAKNA